MSNGAQVCLVDDTTINHIAHVIGECDDVRCCFFLTGMTSTCITVFDRFLLGREIDQDGLVSCFFAWKPPIESAYSIADVHMLMAPGLPPLLHITCTMPSSFTTKNFFLRLPLMTERNEHWIGLLASLVIPELSQFPEHQRCVSDLVARCFNVTRITSMQAAEYNGKEYYDGEWKVIQQVDAIDHLAFC